MSSSLRARRLRPLAVAAPVAALAFAMLAAPAVLGAQADSAARPAGTAALAGVVRDTSGRPLPGVEVVADSLGIKDVTDDSGSFHLPGIPAGKNGFIVRKIGFDPASFETSLAADKTLVIQVTLHASVTTLDAVAVTGERMLPGLANAGFYERERSGLGKFMRPEDVEAQGSVIQPSQLLRTMVGIEVRCRSAGACQLRSRTPPYCLQLFVDGHYVRPAGSVETTFDETLSPGNVGAIEVYRHPSEIPIQFQPPMLEKQGGPRALTGQAGCGVVVVWTKIKAMR